MEMQGQRSLAITQQQAWEALNDPEVLKLCIPGCDRLEATSELQYSVGLALKIGPVSAKFNGKISLSDMQPPEAYTISFDGQGGVAGFGKGQAKVELTPQDTGCLLSYSVHAQVGGKIAQLGQRLIDGAAKSLSEDFFKRFDEEMQRRHPPSAEAAVALSPASEAGSEPAETGPSGLGSVPGWIWALGVLVLAGLVAWLH